MKERYLSKTHFLTFVYLSKCIINLPCYFGNSKKRFFVKRSNEQAHLEDQKHSGDAETNQGGLGNGQGMKKKLNLKI